MVRWKTDQETPTCQACRLTFHLFLRRHHCRSCGGVFCYLCSEYRSVVVSEGHGGKVRVCRDCYVSVHTIVSLEVNHLEVGVLPLGDEAMRPPGAEWRALLSVVSTSPPGVGVALAAYLREEEAAHRLDMEQSWRSLQRALHSMFYVFLDGV